MKQLSPFPGVLIFASMFGSRRVFVSLLLIILTGIHVQTVQPLALGKRDVGETVHWSSFFGYSSQCELPSF